MLDLIAFDADDTLWHNERLYADIQAEYGRLLAPYQPPAAVADLLNTVELRNLPYFGYGIKSFTLSMLEAAIEISGGQVPAAVLGQVLSLGKRMLAAPLQLLEHAETVVAELARTHTLMIITKGDLLDQETKVERSGLAGYFRQVEVVSDKTPASYAAILAKHRISPDRFLMVGNSLRSDILPVVAVGGWAVYIPYHITWAHEAAVPSAAEQSRFVELEHLGLLPAWVESWVAQRARGSGARPSAGSGPA